MPARPITVELLLLFLGVVALRVLQIIPSLDQAGAEKQLVYLAQGLKQAGVDVHIAVLTRSGPLAEPLRAAGIPVQLIGKRWKVDPAALLRLERFIRQLAPDVVHTWLFAANAYGRAAALRAGVRHVIAGERCVDLWKTWAHLAIDRALAKRTEALVTNSSGVVEFYAARKLPRDKFVVIPNGIAVPPVPDPAIRAAVRSELGLPADAWLIGAVGRLWPQKRYKDLIWAADLLKVVRHDVHLLIAGDGPERERLEHFRDKVQIRDRVHFLGQRPDVPRLLAALDCFWLASGYEGQSNALMEAMAVGLPVVVTEIPGNQDLVESGVSGYLVPVGDRAAFARWTLTLLEDPPLAARLGTAARLRMEEQFSIEQMVARHVALYRRCVEG